MLLTRRNFLMKALAGGALLPFLQHLQTYGQSVSDSTICMQKFYFAGERKFDQSPIGDVVEAIAESFIGTDYVEGTLESEGEEHLIVNMHGFDCVTLCENALAIARCVKLKKNSFAEFRKQLQLIRYRDGIINGYPSRLHYFTDWIDDNEEKKIVHNVTEDIGGKEAETFIKVVNFMSAHRSSYAKLQNGEYFLTIQSQEGTLNQRPHRYIPKERVALVADRIHHGDILAITTGINGLDIAHAAIAFRKSDGSLHLLHAPVPKTKVQITELTLPEYLLRNSRHTGIMIARPVEPVF